jgi:2-polyprenyl-6-methoxyphenol hydroxylase-like FAD-dependent oxidoreductase
MRAEFQQILYDATTSRGIDVHFGICIDSIDTDAPSLTLSDGKILAFDLIVGADGK